MPPRKTNPAGDVDFSASPRSGHLVHAPCLQGLSSLYLGVKCFTTDQPRPTSPVRLFPDRIISGSSPEPHESSGHRRCFTRRAGGAPGRPGADDQSSVVVVV